MKKKALSIFLAVIMLLSATAVPVFAADGQTASLSFMETFTVKALAALMEGVTGAINSLLKEGDNFVDADKFVLNDFYEGTTTTLTEKAENARWALGYDTTSLVPQNLNDYNLYLGGFIAIENGFVNSVEGVYDDMAVRTVALSDSSSRGISVFATIDCIGMTNTDIRALRSRLSDFAKENNINAINIFSTHCHSCIDTQGLWTQNYRTIPMNLFNNITGLGTKLQGTDEKYMSFLFEKVTESVKAAVVSMKTGEMTFSQKDIGEEYFNNKNRDSASTLMTEISKFTFTPDDGSTPTIIANMAAHPDVAGLPVSDDKEAGHMISGDYVYYIGETLQKAGYNFMFFNGAICGIYIGRSLTSDGVKTNRRVEISQRYGREIGKMLLALNMTEEEIKNDSFLSSTTDSKEDMESEDYTLWYENWTKVQETTVEPILNVKLKSVRIPVTNNVISIAGKLGLVNHTVLKDKKDLYISTEIGVLDIGQYKAVMMPGEICQDLIRKGNSLTAEGSISKTDFSGKTICDIFGENVLVFGLANDAIGYVVPDNDYAMGLAFGHYQETLSLGKNTASYLLAEYESLA